MVTRYLLVGAGGFMGAIARYIVGDMVAKATGAAFPYGTLLINVSGSFLLGLVFELGTERYAMSPDIRTFLAIGVLGAYTTFSTFSLETVKLLQDGAVMSALVNAGASVVLALAGVFAGMAVARLV